MSRHVRCEFVGGPKDGEYIAQPWPPPPDIRIPMYTRPVVSLSEETSDLVNHRVGVYIRSPRFHEWDWVDVDDEILHDISDVHEAIRLSTGNCRSIQYDWQGE